MTSTNLFSSTAFVYVNSDVPEGMTLRAWRRAREDARRQQSQARRARRAAARRPRLRGRFAV
jgi:hypothetical protein